MPTEEEENTIFGDVSGDINIGFGDNQINDRDQRQFRVNPNAVRPDGIPVIKDITFPPALSSFSDNKSPDANFQYVRFQAFHRKGNQAKWEAASAFCEQKGWKFKILTEKEIFGK